jgi:type I restriction enzyme S subunit
VSYTFSSYELNQLANFTDIQPGFAFKSDKFLDDARHIALVKGENVQQGYIEWASSKYWHSDEYDNFSKYHLKTGDIVLAMDRPWVTSGLKWSYIKKHDPKSLLVQRVARIRAKSGLNQTYLRCIISSKYFTAYIQPIVTGVNVPHISGKQIGDFYFPLPAPNIQKKIAAILSSYDDLIENNQRRITLLEKMAEEIYREWFVRFRFPGYQSAEFEKGIPKGWETDYAHKFFGHVKGKSYSGNEIFDDMQEKSVPFINLKSFNRGGGYRENGLKYYTGTYRKEQIVKEGDVVMAVTDMTQNREVVGRVARVPDVGSNGAVVSLDVIKLTPKTISSTFLYSYLKYSGFGDFIKGFANGANVLHLNADLVTQQKIVIPPENLRTKFENLVNPIHEQIGSLSKSIQILEQTRSQLLPRLISGKLSVENLDIQFPPSMCEDGAA